MAYYYPPPITINSGISNSSLAESGVANLSESTRDAAVKSNTESQPATESVGIVNS